MRRITNSIVSVLSLLMLFAGEKAVALNYTIAFTGSGASKTVQSVIAQNLTKGVSVTVPAGNVLVLTDQKTSLDQYSADNEGIRICPKPEEGLFEISFLAQRAGAVSVYAYSVDGRKIGGSVAELQPGESKFKLMLPKGFFVIHVAGNGYAYSTKMLSQTGTSGCPGITFIGAEKLNSPAMKKSNNVPSVSMLFSAGDRILYKGVSGNYSTIVTDIPSSSKTINFDFVECKDATGNNYAVVKIGTQTWMAENLKTSKYRNGDNVINFTNSNDWGMYSIGSWCIYNNDAANETNFGKLYNWFAVSDSRNIAPVGWHVASDAEWSTLTAYLNEDGGKLKLTGTGHWTSPNTGATNETGFSALPGGDRGQDNGTYEQLGTGAFWWTSTPQNANYAFFRSIGYSSAGVGRSGSRYVNGLAVRCVKDADLPTLTTTTPSSITYTTAVGGGNITNDGGAPVTARGVCWSTSQNPTIADSKSVDGIGSGAFTSSIMGLNINTTYYVRAYATNSSGTAYGEQVVFNSKPYDALTVTDADGNLYHTITIGNQIWMSENLKTTKYRNGDPIGYVTDNSSWSYTYSGAYCWYNNDINNKNIYGAIYNGYAVQDSRNIAPVGWHVPSFDEWTALINYLGGEAVAGGQLKEAGLSHWSTPNASATNSSAFTALPSGVRHKDTGTFINLLNYAHFWASTPIDQYNSKQIILFYDQSKAGPSACSNNYGNVVRCIKNSTPTLSTVTPSSITSTIATCGGNVTADGGEAVTEFGVCWSTSQSPTISNFKKNVGSGKGAFSTSITGLTPNTTYYVRAYATNSVGTAYGQQITFKTLLTDPITVTDIDGNVYSTVTIGNQTWMTENLKTTKYNDGTAIPLISNDYDWTVIASGAYCWPNGSVSNKETYGAIYNWHAINTGKLAPAGWHVPAKSEYDTLVAYLGGADIAASKLKEAGNAHWISGNTDATNSSGFYALPAGYRSSSTGNYQQFGAYGMWWTTGEVSQSNAYHFGMNSGSSATSVISNSKLIGCCVRCIKNTIPTISINAPSFIMSTGANFNGEVTSDGGEFVTEYGVCWSTSQSPTILNSKKAVGSGSGAFSTSIAGLTPNTTYYVRAYATNKLGTAYGQQITFKTLLTDPVTVTDIDGNIYHTVTIGNQTWMVENLKTTRLNDGTSISLTNNNYSWSSLTTPGCGWINNDSNTKSKYGAYYNYYAVATGKLAPAGWHVATELDWITLATYFGGFSVAGGKLKEAGTANWISPNIDATNETGFTALPGGYRTVTDGSSINVTKSSCWWAATVSSGKAGRVVLNYNSAILDYGYETFNFGFCVRCVKD